MWESEVTVELNSYQAWRCVGCGKDEDEVM